MAWECSSGVNARASTVERHEDGDRWYLGSEKVVTRTPSADTKRLFRARLTKGNLMQGTAV